MPLLNYHISVHLMNFPQSESFHLSRLPHKSVSTHIIKKLLGAHVNKHTVRGFILKRIII